MRKSIGLKNQSRQLATPGHVIFAYNIVQRCLSLLVWLLGVDYVLCTPCTAGSKGHRLSGSLLWVYVTISIFRGVGLSFHAFNECRPPWATFYILACINCCTLYHASDSLGLNHICAAIRWWLGISHTVSPEGNPLVCPHCPDKALDTPSLYNLQVWRGCNKQAQHLTYFEMHCSAHFVMHASLSAHL